MQNDEVLKYIPDAVFLTDDYAQGVCPKCHGLVHIWPRDEIITCVGGKARGDKCITGNILNLPYAILGRTSADYQKLNTKIDWAIEGFLAMGHLTILAAYPGHYKSWLALYVGNCIANGIDAFGRRVTQRPVLYLDKENSPAIIEERTRLLGYSDEMTIWGVIERAEPPMVTARGALEKFYLPFIERTDPKPVLIFDTMTRFHNKEENSNDDMKLVTSCFKRMASAGAAVLLLHHAGKSNGDVIRTVRGASEIEGNADVVYAMKKTSRCNVLINCTKTRFNHKEKLQLQLDTRFGYRFVEIAGKDPEVEGYESN